MRLDHPLYHGSLLLLLHLRSVLRVAQADICAQDVPQLIPKGADADKKLEELRCHFVEGVNKVVIRQLLDDLLEKKVFNEKEAEGVQEARRRQEQAQILINHTRRKGDKASQVFIESLQVQQSFEKNPRQMPSKDRTTLSRKLSSTSSQDTKTSLGPAMRVCV
ncbi:hypothetical protein lerEdw1_004868 [Lerista edwardsae]|nr:hypothetical protein lerEdw1_004868 [Lerista edwardsae]